VLPHRQRPLSWPYEPPELLDRPADIFVPLLIVVLLTRTPNVELWGFPMHFEFWAF